MIPLVQRVDYLFERVRGLRVLHLGCTNAPYLQQALDSGTLLHQRLLGAAAELHGTDLDAEGLSTLAGLGMPHLHLGTLESLAPALAPHRFDLVIAGEIIEHVPDAGAFLRSTRAVMGPSSTLIVTTVNAYCAFRFAQYSLRGRGGLAEPVHPDHVAYYSHATLARLLGSCGLRVTHRAFYDLGREHRASLRPSLRVLNRIATAVAPQLADGIIIEAQWPDAAARSDA